MSLLKNWKLILAAMSVAAMFTACAGSNSGSSDSDDVGGAASEESYDDQGSQAASSGNGGSKKAAAPKKQEPPKEVIDENKLKKAESEANAINDENHKLRKEIFDAKTALGMSTAEDAE